MYVIVSIPSLILSLVLAVYYMANLGFATIKHQQDTVGKDTKTIVFNQKTYRAQATFAYTANHIQQPALLKVATPAVGYHTPWYFSGSYFESGQANRLLFPPVLLQSEYILRAKRFSRPPPFSSLSQA